MSVRDPGGTVKLQQVEISRVEDLEDCGLQCGKKGEDASASRTEWSGRRTVW